MGSYVDCGQRGSAPRSLSEAAVPPEYGYVLRGATLTILSLAASVVVGW